MSTAARALPRLLALVALGLTAAACGNSSSSATPTSSGSGGPGSAATTTATLAITNSSLSLLEVQLQSTPVGLVPPQTAGTIPVAPGTFAVYLRRATESVRRYYGHWSFAPGGTARLRFDPGVSFNLEVVNRGQVGLHVLVDQLEVDQVAAGEQRDIWVEPGTREVHLRKQYETRLIPMGTHVFPAAGSGLPVVTIYY